MSASPLEHATLRALAIAVLVATGAHVWYLPLWTSALVPAAVGLRLALGRPPGRWLLIPLVLGAFAAVLLQFRTLSGTTAGGTFFAAMLALKFLESRDTRDAGLLACLAYFYATAVFLSTQAIGMAAYVLLSLGVTTWALTLLAAPTGGPPSRHRARQAALLLLQAVPVMLVLFVLFPRIPGPLWGLGGESESARTGLSDTMSPGSLSRLTESSEVAFRVQFDDAPPPPGRRYWRGPVFWAFDGRTWSRGERATETTAAPEATGASADYVVILEPHRRRWLFGLDLPLPGATGAEYGGGHNLLADERVRSVRRYELRSLLDYRLEPSLPQPRRRRALQLPGQAAPEARALARRWADASATPRGVVERALGYFREQGFVYTLTPPAVGGDPVDGFLFDTRAGFCEHYASAFTVLMRAAGIPARVVTGYLGGETNDLGDYLIVRQSDAHAWAEVWLPERGWTRVDPTSAVSSERIEGGISGVAGADERLATLSRGEPGWIRSAALAWDSVNHGWNRLVLGYGPELQQRLLSRFGLGELGRYALAGMAVIAGALALAAVALLPARAPQPTDPALAAWRRATARLARAGIERRPGEGPRALAARVARERPELAGAFGRIARAYIALRYQRRADAQALRRLRRAVRAFRPRALRRQAQSMGSAGRAGWRAGKWWPRRRQ